jgi:hypothetical protein
MLIHIWIWQTLSLGIRLVGAKSDHPDNLAIAVQSVQKSGYLLQPDRFMMPLTCSTGLLYWSYAEQPSCSLS